MSNNNFHSKETDEIDLIDIKNAIASFTEAVGFFVFRLITFVCSKWYFVLFGLLISFFFNFNNLKSYLGVENTISKSVSYNILLVPQYESIDYLDQLVSNGFHDKIVDKDIQEAKLIGVDDLYYFLAKDSLYPSIYKNSITKVDSFEEGIHNYPLSKNYRFQLLTLDADATFDIDAFLLKMKKYFDENTFFNAKKSIETQRLENQIIALKQGLQASNTSLNSDINQLKTKQYAIDEIAKLEQQQITASSVVYVVDYFKVERESTAVSPTKQLIKDSFKYVVLFLLLGGLIDLLKYYRKKK